MSGNQDVFRMPVGGGEPIALTRHPANDFAPAWSPDGKRIAFHSFRAGTRHVFVSAGDDDRAVQITDGPSNDWSPRWAPDGRSLTFHSDRSGPVNVFVVAANERAAPRQLTFDGGVAPAWAPDGRAITFTNRRGLWTVAAEGGAPKLLVPAADVLVHAWSRDGRTIYYRRQAGQDTASLWALDVAGGEAPRRVLQLDDPVRRWTRPELAVSTRELILSLTEHDADLWLVELEDVR